MLFGQLTVQKKELMFLSHYHERTKDVSVIVSAKFFLLDLVIFTPSFTSYLMFLETETLSTTTSNNSIDYENSQKYNIIVVTERKLQNYG